MGVNLIFNGHIYWFEDDAQLDELLDQACNDATDTDKENAIYYDDEL